MVFSSIVFLSVFLPVVFLLHLALPGIRLKNALLVLASLLFYAYGEPVYVLLMIASALANYCFALLLEKLAHRKAILFVAVAANLGTLAVFKYAGFLAESVNALGIVTVPVPDIALPIGISFFTFQILSYVIDVYQKTVRAQKSFAKVLLYVSFFPQLIAGPIVKYHDVEQEILDRQVTVQGAAAGIRRFLCGLSKKVLLSNVLGLTADTLFAAELSNINVCTAWIAAVSYVLQIYFDFSGYSDMALGLGEMFGFHFKENFHYPYVADSVQDFWRRWHMSLTGWFRQYLYFPLGGNRKGKGRTVFNKFFVFFCTGLWHGANVTFIVWGLFHGFFLMLEEYLPKRPKGRLISVVAHVYTLLVVTVGFVIFRADTMAQALYFLREMFAGFHFEPAALSLAAQQLTPLYLTVLAAAVVCSLPWRERFGNAKWYGALAVPCSIAGLLLCMLSLSGSTYNPFIYFRF